MKRIVTIIRKIVGTLSAVLGILLIFYSCLFFLMQRNVNIISVIMNGIIGVTLLLSADYLYDEHFLSSTCTRIHNFYSKCIGKIKSLSSLQKASIALSIILLLSVVPLPYGFYIILRLVTAIIAVCWAVKLAEQEKTTLAIISAGVALLFQPFFKITLDKLTWNIIDVLLAVCLIIIINIDNQIPNNQ